MTTSTPTPSVRHVLIRRNWRRTPSGWMRLPGEVRLGSFDDADEADAERRRREREARRRVNPFRCGGDAAHYWTQLDEPRLRDWMLDHGLTPPEGDGWSAWYERENGGWDEGQREAVWEALSEVRFFAVLERPARPAAYVLVRTSWWYDDLNYLASCEGGEAVTAFRSRRRADEERARLNTKAVEDELANFYEPRPRPDAPGRYETWERVRANQDPFDAEWAAEGEVFPPLDQVPFYEVVEIDWGDAS